MNNKITPEWIAELPENHIFVFGSNESGFHGKGAAKLAMKWGAVWGQAYGLYGQTYALPTVSKNINGPLPISRIKHHVNVFMECCKNNPHLTFLVTEIGCGLAGLSYTDIGPLFIDIAKLNNVFLPQRFWNTLTK